MNEVRLEVGDCLDVFSREPPESLDSLVQDWPAGVSFMGRGWDGDHGGRGKWIAHWTARARAGLLLCKPGAHSLTWALPRTQHWAATALEDAGWEIRDSIHHTFGTGWPKNGRQLKPAHEVWILARRPLGKGLTVAENVKRWGVGELFVDACRVPRGSGGNSATNPNVRKTRGCKPIAQPSGTFFSTGQGDGYEPDPAGSFPPNAIFSHCNECETTGTRVVRGQNPAYVTEGKGSTGMYSPGHKQPGEGIGYGSPDGTETIPAFDCLAGCPACGASVLAPSGGAAPRCAQCGEAMGWCCAVASLDEQSSAAGMHSAGAKAERGSMRATAPIGYGSGTVTQSFRHGDAANGSAASRFFPTFSAARYSAKPATSERDAGLDAFFWRRAPRHPFGFERVTRGEWERLPPGKRAEGNVHATVKGISLLEWLQRLVTPPGGRTADGTAGSGGTAIAAHRQGFDYLGCDVSSEAIEIARARLAFWRSVPSTATMRTLARPSARRSADQPSLFDRLAPTPPR